MLIVFLLTAWADLAKDALLLCLMAQIGGN